MIFIFTPPTLAINVDMCNNRDYMLFHKLKEGLSHEQHEQGCNENSKGFVA